MKESGYALSCPAFSFHLLSDYCPLQPPHTAEVSHTGSHQAYTSKDTSPALRSIKLQFEKPHNRYHLAQAETWYGGMFDHLDLCAEGVATIGTAHYPQRTSGATCSPVAALHCCLTHHTGGQHASGMPSKLTYC